LISAALVSTIPICSNSIQDITSNPATKTPWKAGTADVGVEYFPGDQNGGAVGRMTTSGTTYPDTVYAAAPRFHIQDFGPSPVAGQGEIYQIDAVGFGGTASAVAVVRSTFSVYTDSWDPSK
jgi:Tfp pilus assembly protein PilX